MGNSFSTNDDRATALGLAEKEEQGLKRRVLRKVSGALEHVPTVKMSADYERNVRIVTVTAQHEMTEQNHLQYMWVRMTASPADKDKIGEALKVLELKPGDEPKMCFELPNQMEIALFPRITAFTSGNLHGSWASPTYELASVRSGYMVLQEMDEELEKDEAAPVLRGRSALRSRPERVEVEVVGDLDDSCRSVSPPVNRKYQGTTDRSSDQSVQRAKQQRVEMEVVGDLDEACRSLSPPVDRQN